MSAAGPPHANSAVPNGGAAAKPEARGDSATARDAASLDLRPVTHVEGIVALPGSKSISNRTLLLSALAQGTTTLIGLLDADDTAHMVDALRALGAGVERTDDRCTVVGVGGAFPNRDVSLFLGNAGTAVRPLTAVLAMQGGGYTIAGVRRMHERPIGDLVDALQHQGCTIRYTGKAGYPPLAVGASGGHAGGHIPIRGDVSSQFLSALLMALPVAHGATTASTTIELTTPLVSRPYAEITTRLMRRFGVAVQTPDESTFQVPPTRGYASPGELHVEGDASAASYFLAAGAIGGGPVRVTGVGRESIQGDIAFADVLARLGADIRFGPDWIEARGSRSLAGGTIDCSAIPDAAMTLAIVALFANAPTRLVNIGSWRVKETDRISAMATELAKLGATLAAGNDWLEIAPLAHFRRAHIDTYDDHRIAMCFALAALGGAGVTINDPGCVRKTFPRFFETFAKIAHRT